MKAGAKTQQLHYFWVMCIDDNRMINMESFRNMKISNSVIIVTKKCLLSKLVLDVKDNLFLYHSKEIEEINSSGTV